MSSQFTLTYKPTLAKFSKQLAGVDIKSFLVKQIKLFAAEVEREAKIATPKDKGGLKSSIRQDKIGGGIIVRPHVPYARWIHEGKMTRHGKTILLQGRGRGDTPRGGKKYMKIAAEKAAKGFEKRMANRLDKHIKVKLRG